MSVSNNVRFDQQPESRLIDALRRRLKYVVLPPILALGAVAWLLGLVGHSAQAGGCAVPVDFATIQAAVSDPACPVITVAAGVYTETVVITRNVEIQGEGFASTIIDGGGDGPVVHVDGPHTVAIYDVTIRNGFNDATDGGGIRSAGSLTLDSSLVTGNAVSDTIPQGGGIYNTGALTLTNSRVTYNVLTGTLAFGGGIHNSGVAVLLDDTRVTSNTIARTEPGNQAFGGGINNDGRLLVAGGVVRRNTIDADIAQGGGVRNSGQLELTDVLVAGNSMTGSIGTGGGIFNLGQMTATQLTLQNNNADANVGFGGGLYAEAISTGSLAESTLFGNQASTSGGGVYNRANLTISGTTFLANHAAGTGGGIYHLSLASIVMDATVPTDAGINAVAGGAPPSELRLTGALLWGNSADSGGGLYSNGLATVANTTFFSNTATENGGGALQTGQFITYTLDASNVTWSQNAAGLGGGGLYVAISSTAVIRNATIVSNTAGAARAGGVELDTNGDVTLLNSILAFNTDRNCLGVNLVSAGHNLEAANECELGAEGDQINTDPLIGPLMDNGGQAPTHDLLAGSPALDAGETITCALDDARGVPRPVGAECDIGALEALQFSIEDASFAEGNSGPTAAEFVVSAGAPVPGPDAFSVEFSTASGTAAAGSDFEPISGTLTLPAGSVTGTVTVFLAGDTNPEPDETFELNLSNPTGAHILAGQAIGTILNDDWRAYWPLIMR